MLLGFLVPDSIDISKVKSGQYKLFCALPDGYRQVDNNLILTRIDDIWIFTNGQSKTCNIIKD